MTGTFGPVDRLLGLLDRAEGDLPSAREHLRRARRAARRCGLLPWEVRCASDLVPVLLATGDREAAEGLRRRYGRVAVRLGLAEPAAVLAGSIVEGSIVEGSSVERSTVEAPDVEGPDVDG